MHDPVAVALEGVARAAWSNRQILERMVDFWSNHLNVPNPFGEVWDVRHSYDRDVIRRYALGRFTDMLVASAKHPAMLRYLAERGVVPGEALTLVDRQPFGGPLTVRLGEVEHALGPELAAAMRMDG